MPPAPPSTHELPCPHCGYDLRASPTRCPECGKEIKGPLTASRIPWVNRHHKGRIKAYLQTHWFVLRHPRQFAEESAHLLAPRPARRFHLISLLLATIIGTALLTLTFALRGEPWNDALQVGWGLHGIEAGSLVSQIAKALTDTYWIVLPLAISVFLSLALSMAAYRFCFRIMTPGRPLRRRIRRLSLYASALTPTLMLMLGLLAAAGMVLSETDPEPKHEFLRPVVIALSTAVALAVVFIFYIPTMLLVARTGRISLLRTFLMFPLYPMAIATTFYLIAIMVFWTIGYIAVAYWSMTH